MKKLIFVALFCCSCASNRVFISNVYGRPALLCSQNNLYVNSNNLPPNYLAAIDKAAEFWNDTIGRRVFQLGGQVDFGPDEIDHPVIIVVGLTKQPEDLPENAYAMAKLRIGAYGCTVGATIKIKDMGSDVDEMGLLNIIYHEFGHVLGLDHSYFKEDLMYRYISVVPGAPNYYGHIKYVDPRTIAYLQEYYTK